SLFIPLHSMKDIDTSSLIDVISASAFSFCVVMYSFPNINLDVMAITYNNIFGKRNITAIDKISEILENKWHDENLSGELARLT
ncbi:hypothetical protein, partial [Klebsiella pneumoniae]|uniref:hypothetical protein n=1 Tax=Klebsiella pneumoniae TaxID=573 RepID=UPI003EE04789